MWHAFGVQMLPTSLAHACSRDAAAPPDRGQGSRPIPQGLRHTPPARPDATMTTPQLRRAAATAQNDSPLSAHRLQALPRFTGCLINAIVCDCESGPACSCTQSAPPRRRRVAAATAATLVFCETAWVGAPLLQDADLLDEHEQVEVSAAAPLFNIEPHGHAAPVGGNSASLPLHHPGSATHDWAAHSISCCSQPTGSLWPIFPRLPPPTCTPCCRS